MNNNRNRMSSNKQEALIYQRNLEQDYYRQKERERDQKKRAQIIVKGPRVDALPTVLFSRQREFLKQRQQIMQSLGSQKTKQIVDHIAENKILSPPSSGNEMGVGKAIQVTRTLLVDALSMAGSPPPPGSGNAQLLADITFAKEKRQALLRALTQTSPLLEQQDSQSFNSEVYKNTWVIEEKIKGIPPQHKRYVSSPLSKVFNKDVALFGGVLIVTALSTTLVFPFLVAQAPIFATYLGLSAGNAAGLAPLLQYSGLVGATTGVSSVNAIISSVTTFQTSYKIYSTFKKHGIKSTVKEQLLSAGQIAIQGVLANQVFGPLGNSGLFFSPVGIMQGQLAGAVFGNVISGPLNMYIMEEERARDEQIKKQRDQESFMLKEAADRKVARMEIAGMLRKGLSVTDILKERQKNKLEMNTIKYNASKAVKYAALASSIAVSLTGGMYAMSLTATGMQQLLDKIPLIGSVLTSSLSLSEWAAFEGIKSPLFGAMVLSMVAPIANKLLRKLKVIELVVQASLWSLWVLKTPLELRRYYYKHRYGDEYKTINKDTVIRDLFPEPIRKRMLQYRFLEILTNMTSEQILRGMVETTFNVGTSAGLRVGFQNMQKSLESMNYSEYLQSRQDFTQVLSGVLNDRMDALPDMKTGARTTILNHWMKEGVSFNMKNIFQDPLEKGVDTLDHYSHNVSELNLKLYAMKEDYGKLLNDMHDSGLETEKPDLYSAVSSHMERVNNAMGTLENLQETMSDLSINLKEKNISPTELNQQLSNLKEQIDVYENGIEGIFKSGISVLNTGQEEINKKLQINEIVKDLEQVNSGILEKINELETIRGLEMKKLEQLHKQDSFMRGTRTLLADNLSNRNYQKQRVNVKKVQTEIQASEERLGVITDEIEVVNEILGQFNANNVVLLENPKNVELIQNEISKFEGEMNARLESISDLIDEQKTSMNKIEKSINSYNKAFDKALLRDEKKKEETRQKEEEESIKIAKRNAEKIHLANKLKTSAGLHMLLKNKVSNINGVVLDYDKLEKLMNKENLTPEDFDLLEKEFVNKIVETEKDPVKAKEIKNCILNPEDPACIRKAGINKAMVVNAAALGITVATTGGISAVPLALGGIAANIGWVATENNILDSMVNTGLDSVGLGNFKIDYADELQNITYGTNQYTLSDLYIAGLVDLSEVASNPSYFNIAKHALWGNAAQTWLWGSLPPSTI